MFYLNNKVPISWKKMGLYDYGNFLKTVALQNILVERFLFNESQLERRILHHRASMPALKTNTVLFECFVVYEKCDVLP